MAYVGAGTDAADAAQPVYLIINGIKIDLHQLPAWKILMIWRQVTAKRGF